MTLCATIDMILPLLCSLFCLIPIVLAIAWHHCAKTMTINLLVGRTRLVSLMSLRKDQQRRSEKALQGTAVEKLGKLGWWISNG